MSRELGRPPKPDTPALGKRMSTTKSYLYSVLSLEQAAKAPAALDPKAHYVGVAVGQTGAAESGAVTIVVVVVGFPR